MCWYLTKCYLICMQCKCFLKFGVNPCLAAESHTDSTNKTATNFHSKKYSRSYINWKHLSIESIVHNWNSFILWILKINYFWLFINLEISISSLSTSSVTRVNVIHNLDNFFEFWSEESRILKRNATNCLFFFIECGLHWNRTFHQQQTNKTIKSIK